MRLIYKEGDRYHDYFLRSKKISIGRGPKCDLVLFDTTVSKEHVHIYYDKEQKEAIIKDLGSSNGTLLNGQRIKEVVLEDGDIIQIGQTKMIFTTYEDKIDEEEIEQILGAEDEQAESAALRPFLVIEDEEGVRNFPLGFENITIGYKSGNDIVIKGKGISRFHSEIYFEDNQWWIKDLDSTNGTFVNGQKIEEPHRLEVGDQIQIGDIFIRFEIPQEKKLLQRFMALDPKLKIPIIAGGLFLLSLILFSLFSGQDTSQPHQKIKNPKISKLILKGIHYLKNEQYPKAAEYFKKVSLKYPSQEAFSLLHQISIQLNQLDILDFKKWDLLKKRLEKLKNLIGENQDSLEFIEEKIELVKREKKFYSLYQKALKLSDSIELSRLEDAHKIFAHLEKNSLTLNKKSRNQRILLEEKISKKYITLAKAYSNSVDPNWTKAWRCYKQALEYVKENPGLTTEIKSLIEECRKEMQAKKNYEEAYNMYQKSKFAQARKYLRRIPSDSYYAEKARYIQKDIENLDKLGTALSKYREGEGEEALEILEEIPGMEALYLRRRIQTVLQWMKLARSCRQNNPALARKYYKKIIDLERKYNSPQKNYYYQTAKSQYQRLGKSFSSSAFVRKQFRAGERALQKQDYPAAFDAFDLAVSNDDSGQYRKKIQKKIQALAKSLFQQAQIFLKYAKRNPNQTLKLKKLAKGIYRLLIHFLPPQHPYLKKAKRALNKL
ncbi:MAG: FHA domain-containing protein [Planctomycetota bacterium]|nr:MAG: FHA domain-containing protein [Planctomycetota bacterium]